MASDRQDDRRGQLDRASQSRIGRRLRLVYRPFMEEPVPDGYIDLLLALRRKERELGRLP
ncbi:NepR family anti-sigma factor [Microvirga sp. Mcv34]|uniref:NepR family anti-sigma factor n=1 Tax=Microvirga sp. Mcv34 TaxID=2926016 RepID=UPI0021CA79DB|nr:NepR family anti-sigma factor [Microvirga sp. Mcv34]